MIIIACIFILAGECLWPVSIEDGPIPLEDDVQVHSSTVIPANDTSSELLIGSLATLGVLCCLIPITLITLYYKNKLFKSTKSSPPFVKANNKRKVSLNMNDLNLNLNMTNRTNTGPRSKCKFYGDSQFDDESSSVMYQEPYKGPVNNPGYHTLAPGSTLPDKALQPMLTARDSSDYAVPTMSLSQPPSLLDIYKIAPPLPPLKPPPTLLMDMSSSPELPTLKKDAIGPFGADIRGIVGSALFAMPESVTLRTELPVNEIKRTDFKLLDVLGESSFGVVHLCALEQTSPQGGVEIEKNKSLHIIKTLKHNVSDINKDEFRNEIRILSNIVDLNIACLVGVISCDPLSAIFEYTEFGDLYQFLRFHDNDELSDQSTLITSCNDSRPVLSYGALLYISSQIASGMKFLESRNVVHRDLSTRNCLVGKKLRIKISDFAVTRSLYSSDYWNVEGRLLLPIRWMPPESILHARFSTKSDVWSFGVTLWEVLTLARDRPLDDLSDSAVVEHICRSCQADDPPPLLQQPELSCRELYQMMTSCWRPAERQRPPFWEILMFLQRKNLGYSLDYWE